MRKLSLLMMCTVSFMALQAQQPVSKKSPALSISLGTMDFKTAQSIRSSSLSTVLKDKNWEKFSKMDATFGLNYTNGISQFLDYSLNIYGSIINYTYRDKGIMAGTESLLLETDASAHLKLLNDDHIVVPYLTAGAGISVYKTKWDAIVPVGAGIQVKIGSDTWFNSNFQYRLPVTQRANYHFLYTIGVGTSLKKK